MLACALMTLLAVTRGAGRLPRPTAGGVLARTWSHDRVHAPCPRFARRQAAMLSASAAPAGTGEFYVTTPIYYVNDKPHIGHAYTTVVCDTLARFHRLDGKRVRLVTGTDEHGQKVQQSAEKAGVTPQAFADDVSTNFRSLAAALECTHDDFIRTTEPRHKATVHALWHAMSERGYIYKGAYEGWYSVRDEAFYAESELVDGKAPTGAEVAWVAEPSYFFKLSAFTQPLLELYERQPDFIMPTSRRNEVLRFVEGGLTDLSISRTAFSWGIPVPEDEEHVIYVWLDALTNYLTASGHDPSSLERAIAQGSLPPSDGAIWPPTVHVVGKDILRFHTVFWPAFLMATGLPLPHRVFAHGWWTIEGAKMSKSVGNVVDPFRLVSQYGLDATRYFLLCGVPFGSDGDFSEATLVAVTNANLANQLGNLLHRTLTLVTKNCGGEAPDPGAGLSADDEALLSAAYELLPSCREHMRVQAVHRMGDELSAVVRSCNEYIDAQAPWALRKSDPPRMGVVLWTLLEALRCVAILMQPMTPGSAAQMLDQLGVPAADAPGVGAGATSAGAGDPRGFAAVCSECALRPGAPVQKPSPVFPRLELAAESSAPGGDSEPHAEEPAAEEDESWLDAIEDIEAAVKAQGDRVRALKAQKADKAEIGAEVAKLLKLKSRLPAEQSVS